MKESKMSPSELYLEKSRRSGLMTEENKAVFEGVAEMLKHPYSYEQAKAQIEDGKRRRKKVSYRTTPDKGALCTPSAAEHWPRGFWRLTTAF